MSRVRLELAAGIAEITLNNPDKYNALDKTMLDDIVAAITSAEQDRSVRVAILTGAGRGFCGGADVSGNILDRVTSMEQRMRDGINRVVSRLHRSPLPIIAAVNGPAAGGGVGLALACDIVLASRSAFFQLSFAKVGLSLDCGTSMFIQRAIGAPRARAMAFLGDRINASTAAQWGLIWQVVDDGVLLDEARNVARRIAENAPLAVRQIKTVLDAGWTADIDNGLEQEIIVQAKLFLTEDLQEGVMAFREKRPPEFNGR